MGRNYTENFVEEAFCFCGISDMNGKNIPVVFKRSFVVNEVTEIKAGTLCFINDAQGRFGEIEKKVKVKKKKEKALELMKSVGLSEEHSKRKILKLSGGEQQRIAIARSLSYNPKIIIADEPTGNLDKDTESEILKIFKHLAKDENKCVIIVTHSQNVCDEVDTVYELGK